MTKSDLLRQKLKEYLIEYFMSLGITEPNIDFERPGQSEYGDLACNAALKYTKILERSPKEIAEGAMVFLKGKNVEEIEDVRFAPPGYINIFLNSRFAKEVLDDVLSLGREYGNNEVFRGQTWVIEHTSPNPNKAMHLGHLRNNIVGMSLARLLEYSGAVVICDAVDNNRGIAIAKLMWGFLEHMKKDVGMPTEVEYWHSNKNNWNSPSDVGMLPDRFVSKCYVLGESDFKNDPSVEEKIRSFVVRWEGGDSLVRELWSHVLRFSYDGMNRTLSRIGNRWDRVWHEHEHYQDGKEFVYAGLKNGIFKKLEDGAVLTDLSSYNLSDTILLKADGTSLYITQDIALTALKKKEYKADKLIWVIGPEQSTAMKQLFAVCEQLGIGRISDFNHVSYGYVGLKTDEGFKKMSSREGTVVLIDELIDMAKSRILERSTKEGDGSCDDALAEKLALAAVKFSLLKADRTQDVAFDVERSIDVHGDTGVYVMYTYARISSILRKAANLGVSISPQSTKTGEAIAKKLAMFDTAVMRSMESYSVHHVSQYLLQLCSDFNSWYNKETILDGGAEQPHKLAVAQSVAQVINNGLSLLGIETVDRM